MATSVLMASSHDHNANHTLSEDHDHLPPPPPDHVRTKAAKPSSISTPRRKLTRGNDKKKKPPQRGMGVDKLERLRLKKLSELDHNNNNNTPSSSSFPYAVIPAASFPNAPASFVPLHLGKYGAFAGGATAAVNGVGGGFNLNQPPAVLVPRVGLFHGQGMASEDNSQGNLYGVGNGSEASRELSSTPNMIDSFFDRCSVCHQKKLNFVRQNLAYKGLKDMNAPSYKTSSGFAGFNVGNSQNNKGRTALVFEKNFSFQAAATYSVSNIDQGIVATGHRKGSSSGGGSAGNFFMEYEFFPAVSGKGSKIDSHDQSENELMMTMKKAVGGSEDPSSVYEVMAGGGGNTSCVSTTATCGGAGLVDASSSIDLSLRLSY